MESLPAATESSAETWPTADGAQASLLVSAHPPCEGSQVSRALVAWLPNGIRVLYADGPQLYAVEADGSGLELLADASPDIRLGTSRYVVGHVTHATVSPDGTHVAYAVCRYYEPDGYENPQILACVRPWRESSEPKCDYPITADRTYAFYDIPAEIGSLHYEISVRHLPTDTTQRLFVGDAPVWSPDGSRIAFYVGGGGVYPGIFVDAREGATRFPLQRGLYTMALDGSDVRRVPLWNWTDGWGDYPDFDVPPAWSPDGRWLAIVRHGGDEQMIYLVEADVRAVPRRLTTTVSGPAWSPDGARLAFARPDGDKVALFTIAADGSDAQRVTPIDGWQPPYGEPDPTQAWIEAVAWSPTGDALAYACGQSLCIVALDGTPVGTSPLRLDGGSIAAWSPDGSRVVIASAERSENGVVLYHMAPDGSDLQMLASPPADGSVVPAESALTLDVSGCTDGTIVPNPGANLGLVSDCQVLLVLRDTLGGSMLLNWSPFYAISEWAGVVVGGSPFRVIELQLEPLYKNTVGYYRELSGVIPPGLSQLTQLRVLNLGGNKLSGVIPPALGKLEHLRTLDLSSNNLSGVIPPDLGDLTELQHLYLGNNSLGGVIPHELGTLTTIVHLHLEDNRLLTGTIPRIFRRLQELVILKLGGNALTGAIPEWIGQLTKLEEIDLAANQLSGSIPTELGQLSSLRHLYLSGNQLSGVLPPELGRLSNLTKMYLDHNYLGGQIPSDLGDLVELTELALSVNQLTGPIPKELSKLINLELLFLSRNQLTRSIPEELGQMVNLYRLYLSYNELTGSIPASIGEMLNLRELVVHDNRLSGSIPHTLVDLPNLQEIFLAGNELVGCVPHGLPVADRDKMALPDCETAE